MNFLSNINLLEAAESTSPEIIFDLGNFVENLKYMGLGMLGIFVVVGVVMAITYLLNSVTGKKK